VEARGKSSGTINNVHFHSVQILTNSHKFSIPHDGAGAKVKQQNKKAKKTKKAQKFNPYGHGEQVKRVASSAPKANMKSGERSFSGGVSKRS
jgi:hypothetical protein